MRKNNLRAMLIAICGFFIFGMAYIYPSNAKVVQAAEGGPVITVDKINPVTPGTEVSVFLSHFPTDLESRWMAVDFSDGASVNVEVDDAGNATTSHRYACGHTGQIMASPLSSPGALVRGPTIETAPCSPPPPQYITPTIAGPETGVEGVKVDFQVTGTPGYTTTVRFGDGETQLVVVTFNENGNATTWHTYGRGAWLVSVDGGNSFEIVINPADAGGTIPPPPTDIPSIHGPRVGKAGEEIHFTVTGTPGTEVTIGFGDGAHAVVTLDADGNGTTSHTFAVGIWTLLAMSNGGGGSGYAIQITENGITPLFLALVAR